MRWFTTKSITVVSALVLALLLVYLFVEIKKEYVKKEKIAAIQTGIEQLVALQKLGYAVHDDRIKMVQEYIVQAHNDLKAMESQWNIMTIVRDDKVTRQQKIEQLMVATKSMINIYRDDLKTSRDYLKC